MFPVAMIQSHLGGPPGGRAHGFWDGGRGLFGEVWRMKESPCSVRVRMNAREREGEGGSPPIDRESEDDGNRWWHW